MSVDCYFPMNFRTKCSIVTWNYNTQNSKKFKKKELYGLLWTRIKNFSHAIDGSVPLLNILLKKRQKHKFVYEKFSSDVQNKAPSIFNIGSKL